MKPLERSAEILVVGAGPAGSTFARELGRHGHDVCLLDRAIFPRPKPCGESLNPGAVTMLSRLGLLPAVMAAEPSPMMGWQISDASGRSAAGTFAEGRALGITREAFDHTLLAAARASGARVYEGMRVAHMDRTPSGWAVTAHDAAGHPSRWTARVLVGADGLRSVVSRRLGLIASHTGRRKASMTFRVAGAGPSRTLGRLILSDEMTVGLAPVHATDSRWNCTLVVPAGEPARRLAASPGPTVCSVLTRPPFRWDDGPHILAGPWTSGPFDRPIRCTVADNAMLIGDAAGYYDPLTGQGIYRALRSAELAAGVLRGALAAGCTSRHRLMPYDRRFRRELTAPRLFQRLVDAVLRPPALRAHAIRAMARSRPFADRIVEVAGDLRPVTSLLRPHFLLPVA